jgi:hypothetical protein
MLETLLQFVAKGGVRSYDDLTERLAISPGMLEALLADLARLGYLRAVRGGCDGACSGCSMGGCSIAGPGRLWVLTEKGTRAADRLG